MKTTRATFILLILTLTTIAQRKEKHGEMMSINGWTIDKITNDTLSLVGLEIFSEQKRIDIIKSDLFGRFYLTVCTNELFSDSITIKVFYPRYSNEQFDYHIDELQNLTIELAYDSNESVTKADYLEFCQRNILQACPDLRTPEWDDDLKPTIKGMTRYKHYCTGEIRTFNDLAAGECDFNKWMKIK